MKFNFYENSLLIYANVYDCKFTFLLWTYKILWPNTERQPFSFILNFCSLASSKLTNLLLCISPKYRETKLSYSMLPTY